tara:strand:- start:1056 stop:1211 length:156 start_codon:yes stop_codon:yes gene_type:complete
MMPQFDLLAEKQTVWLKWRLVKMIDDVFYIILGFILAIAFWITTHVSLAWY